MPETQIWAVVSSSIKVNDDVQALSKSTLHGHNDISDASVAPVKCIPAHDRMQCYPCWPSL